MGGEKEISDQGGKRSSYQKLYADLAEQIDSGQLKPGDRLPTYPELKSRWQVSHATVSKVLRLLYERGYVRSSTRGVFVLQTRQERLLRQLCDAINELEKDGLDPQIKMNRHGGCIYTLAGEVYWNAKDETWESQVF
jgi:DNA-binding GntR family transcriptional regulator